MSTASRDGNIPMDVSPLDMRIDGGKLGGLGDEEDIDELVRNYKENESQKKSDNASGN